MIQINNLKTLKIDIEKAVNTSRKITTHGRNIYALNLIQELKKEALKNGPKGTLPESWRKQLLDSIALSKPQMKDSVDLMHIKISNNAISNEVQMVKFLSVEYGVGQKSQLSPHAMYKGPEGRSVFGGKFRGATITARHPSTYKGFAKLPSSWSHNGLRPIRNMRDQIEEQGNGMNNEIMNTVNKMIGSLNKAFQAKAGG